MAFPLSTAYQFTKVQDDEGNWIYIDTRSNKAHLQIGSRFGMLTVGEKCECCNGIFPLHFFFHNTDDDFLVQTCLKPRIPKAYHIPDNVIVTMPNGARGFFEFKKSAEGFNDSYILDIVSNTNMRDKDHPGMYVFFGGLLRNIKLHGALCRLRMYSRRSNTDVAAKRMTALAVLSRNDVDEVGLHVKIMRMARLW